MLILIATYQKQLWNTKYLSDMNYDVKTPEMKFLLIISPKCMSKWFFKNIFFFNICKTNTWTNESAF